MRRITYLVVAALLAMLVLLPVAVAQDTDPFMPEENAVVVDDAQLQQIAGQPEPPPPTSEPLPVTGGLQVSMLVVPAALLMGLGLLSYVFVLRRE